MISLAFGAAAPDEAVTVPLSTAVDCACAIPPREKTNRHNRTRREIDQGKQEMLLTTRSMTPPKVRCGQRRIAPTVLLHGNCIAKARPSCLDAQRGRNVQVSDLSRK